jgi:hypothetical protein
MSGAPGDWVPFMVSSIVLDALLVIILLMMIPLGFLRGGIREVCTSAGLLFGILLAGQWADRWGSWISGRVDIAEGSAQFLIAIIIVVITAGLIGYGSSAAFSWRPGPGGRMYGAYIALFNGLVLAGFLINTVKDKVYNGDLPNAIDNAFIARALSVGFGWVLLACALGVMAATVFGMFVRERPGEEAAYPQAMYGPHQPVVREPAQRTTQAPPSLPQPEPGGQETEVHPAAPVRIREVRHWEETPETRPEPTQPGYGGGWRQTWPESKGQGPALPRQERPTPNPPSPKRVSGTLSQDEQKPANPRDVLRDWMKDQGSDKSR